MIPRNFVDSSNWYVYIDLLVLEINFLKYGSVGDLTIFFSGYIEIVGYKKAMIKGFFFTKRSLREVIKMFS